MRISTCDYFDEERGCRFYVSFMPRPYEDTFDRPFACETSPAYRCPITDAILQGKQPQRGDLPLVPLLKKVHDI